MDLFVLPSLYEGMPLSILEAMGAGLPVIATAVDGTPEVVEDGETGLLVPPADPAALARAVVRLLDDRALAVRLGQNGRARAEDSPRRRSSTESVPSTATWRGAAH